MFSPGTPLHQTSRKRSQDTASLRPSVVIAGDGFPPAPSPTYHPVSMEDKMFNPSTPMAPSMHSRNADSISVHPSLHVTGDDGQPAPYSPIGMAITDDQASIHSVRPEPRMQNWVPHPTMTFPPSDRPRSALVFGAHQQGDPRVPAPYVDDDTLFTPPAPGFRRVDHDRPRSVG